MFTLLQGQLASLVEADSPLSGGRPLGFPSLIFLFCKVEVIWSWAEMGSEVWWPWPWDTSSCVTSGALLHFSASALRHVCNGDQDNTYLFSSRRGST